MRILLGIAVVAVLVVAAWASIPTVAKQDGIVSSRRPVHLPKDAELSKSILEIEIGPGSNVATGVAQIAGCRFWPRQERRPVYSTSSITTLMACIPRASKGQTDTCSMTAAADTLDKRRSARAQRPGEGP